MESFWFHVIKTKKIHQGLNKDLKHAMLESMIYHAGLNGTGGYISGEVKVAITLQILSGTF